VAQIDLGKIAMSQSGVPWWVTSIYKVGVPTAIACYLVWFLTSRIQTNLEAVQGSISLHIQQQNEEHQTGKQMLQLLRVICAEGAQSSVERKACFE
jgi:hypothetical protein